MTDVLDLPRVRSVLWIPTSVRLPEPRKSVLVCGTWRRTGAKLDPCEMSWNDELQCWKWDCTRVQPENVTYWAEMPEAPT